MVSEAGNIAIDEHTSQIRPLPVLKSLFDVVLDLILTGTIYTVHYMTLPYIFCFVFWSYAVDQTWQISMGILKEFKELFKIVPLSISVFYWSAIISVQSLLWFKSAEEITYDVEHHIYEPLKIILGILKFDFTDPKHAAALFGFFSNLRIFGSRLPFPSFLFERVFRTVKFGKKSLTMFIDASPVPAVQTSTTDAVTDTKPTEPGSSQTSEEKPNTAAQLARRKTPPKLPSVDEKNEEKTEGDS